MCSFNDPWFDIDDYRALKGQSNVREETRLRTLSTAAWVAHNLGIAASFGGRLFGKTALNPSLSAIASEAACGKTRNTT